MSIYKISATGSIVVVLLLLVLVLLVQALPGAARAAGEKDVVFQLGVMR